MELARAPKFMELMRAPKFMELATQDVGYADLWENALKKADLLGTPEVKGVKGMTSVEKTTARGDSCPVRARKSPWSNTMLPK